MNSFNEIVNKKKVILIVICIIILIGIGTIMYMNYNEYENIESTKVLEEMENSIQEGSTEEKQISESSANNVIKNEILEQEEEEKIAIHITGEVKNTGILYLDKGARIADAIEKAGGATKNASLDQVNLAYILEDGQKIYIPNKNEKIEKNAYIISDSGNNVLVEEGRNTSNSEKKGENDKVNINSANQTELETLPGIGPSLAQRIIEYRETNGKFQKIEDIQNVKGIGDSKYNNIKDYICI